MSDLKCKKSETMALGILNYLARVSTIHRIRLAENRKRSRKLSKISFLFSVPIFVVEGR